LDIKKPFATLLLSQASTSLKVHELSMYTYVRYCHDNRKRRRNAVTKRRVLFFSQVSQHDSPRVLPSPNTWRVNQTSIQQQHSSMDGGERSRRVQRLLEILRHSEETNVKQTDNGDGKYHHVAMPVSKKFSWSRDAPSQRLPTNFGQQQSIRYSTLRSLEISHNMMSR